MNIEQTYVFGIMIICGFLVGIVYDLYRVFRWKCRPSKVIIGLLDLLFWLVTALFCFYVLFKINYAEIRFYLFLAFGGGWMCYLLVVSRYFIALFTKIMEVIATISKSLTNLLLLPYKFVHSRHKNFK
ncbi:MAG: hypothetical protein PWP48_471 [Clostridiales bacterium]|nr:hypothetical protein [Clostridiales bacterium]MDK2991238.1 hypothetical protein [Clostridiales bacterium]